ncbi:MAG TPA: class I SAM-dependent methyltransferase [Phycisphaerae bacterium]|nr:class I SAM-dependent methyltransferase [Phycisphaerae bacterium]
MGSYYSERLSAERLRRCYEIAPPRVQQYLEAEIEYVAGRIGRGDVVLELGCGYGRVLERLAGKAGTLVGIDTSAPSLEMGRELLSAFQNCRLLQMDAVALGFADRSFDVVCCIQNGISAFHVDKPALIAEAIRVTKPGGRVLFSSYSPNFWDARLEWFKLQADHGLLGEIDWDATGDGVIVCRDGFRATTIGPGEFESLTAGFDVDRRIEEVDRSSIFCELVPRSQ